MKLLLIAPAVLPSKEEALRKLRLFLRSCERWGIKPNLYGIGTPHFVGYQRLKVDVPLEYLEANGSGYSHVLYTDSWDVLFTGPLSEIIAKYEAMGSPAILVSAHDQLGNCSNEMERYPGVFDRSLGLYRYPNVGGYFAEIPAMLEALRRMKRDKSQYNDDSFAWYDGIQEGWFRPMLDSNCEIFQCRSEENLDVEGPRIFNRITKSHPCILHLAGGYASHEDGKYETLLPWAQKLGLA